MTRLIKQSLTALALAALLVPAMAAAQEQAKPQEGNAPPPRESVKETIGDWEVRCAPDKPDVCILYQIGKTADGQAALEIRVRKLKDVKTKDGQNVPAVVQILTPLGSLLRDGLRLSVDGGKPRGGLYEVCLPNGCIVRDPVSDDFLQSFKAGKKVEVKFIMIEKGEITAFIGLSGFTKAFGKL